MSLQLHCNKETLWRRHRHEEQNQSVEMVLSSTHTTYCASCCRSRRWSILLSFRYQRWRTWGRSDRRHQPIKPKGLGELGAWLFYFSCLGNKCLTFGQSRLHVPTSYDTIATHSPQGLWPKTFMKKKRASLLLSTKIQVLHICCLINQIL